MNSNFVGRVVARRSFPLRVAAIVALVASSVLGLQGQSATPRHRARLSLDLAVHEARRTSTRLRVIVHGTPAEVQAIATKHRLTVLRTLDDIGVLAVNSAELTDLASDSAVDHVSPDRRVRLAMSVSNISTGATQVRSGSSGLLGLGGIPGVTGQGIGVAVLDSGVSSHVALPNVVANISFVTGSARVTDEFGHGTHVAGIIAGSASTAKSAGGLYAGGIAPGAKIVNVRVLGPDGSGMTSDVIAGMEWVIKNRTKYNIRVMNLSFGHPVFEACLTDPLCEEVAKVTSAGIVVVASAGNAGKSADGQHQVLGGISSPGNSPFAITVGALNTWQTTGRSDDSVTTYSSRGPTRYDLAVKPDVVAPGNKIVSLEANGSYLSTNFSALHVAGYGTNAYMRMSGTSMAAPMVSGAVALMLSGNPSLSVSQLKLGFQTGATFLPNDGLMAGGAGSVNFWTTRQMLANTGLLSSLLGTVTGLLTGPSGAAYWDAGTMTGRLYAGTGTRLLSLTDLLTALLNPAFLRWGDLNLVGSSNPLAGIRAKNLLYGQVGDWTNSNMILWGDQIYDPQGEMILWGDSNTVDENMILWGDSVLTDPDPK